MFEIADLLPEFKLLITLLEPTEITSQLIIICCQLQVMNVKWKLPFLAGCRKGRNVLYWLKDEKMLRSEITSTICVRDRGELNQ